jgi:hypothetical protein
LIFKDDVNIAGIAEIGIDAELTISNKPAKLGSGSVVLHGLHAVEPVLPVGAAD